MVLLTALCRLSKVTKICNISKILCAVKLKAVFLQKKKKALLYLEAQFSTLGETEIQVKLLVIWGKKKPQQINKSRIAILFCVGQ